MEGRCQCRNVSRTSCRRCSNSSASISPRARRREGSPIASFSSRARRGRPGSTVRASSNAGAQRRTARPATIAHSSHNIASIGIIEVLLEGVEFVRDTVPTRLLEAGEDLVESSSRSGPDPPRNPRRPGTEDHTSELQSRGHLVCRLLLEKKNKKKATNNTTKQYNKYTLQ